MFAVTLRIILLTPRAISFGYHMSRRRRIGAGNVPSRSPRRSTGTTTIASAITGSENCPTMILTTL